MVERMEVGSIYTHPVDHHLIEYKCVEIIDQSRYKLKWARIEGSVHSYVEQNVSHYELKEQPVKLEVGKTYRDKSGLKVLIVYVTSNQQAFCGIIQGPEISYWYYLDGGTLDHSLAKTHNLVKLYVEPVVHKRDIIWFRYLNDPKNPVVCTAYNYGTVLPLAYQPELHRQTVEFTEQKDV